jgi:DNA modification methylase
MTKRRFRNRLNALSTKEWLKFQKSWFIHNPPPRRRKARQHPAKFPETLAMEFIDFFTKPGQLVLDPMAGTGSTLIACLRTGRHGIGIELNPTYAETARQLVNAECQTLGELADGLEVRVLTGDATRLATFDLPQIDYVLTSPPYWDMLHALGAGTQAERRQDDSLDVVYSDIDEDLGNIADYDEFLETLTGTYAQLARIMRPAGYLTIIVKNIKKGGTIYPLAWDLGQRLSAFFTLKDERIWCQDNVRLAPYGMGNAWVSNTVHHYCLQFRYEPSG